MHDDERIIRAAWRSVVAHGAAGHGAVRPEHLLESVLARHRERHRRYHTVTHVAWVVRLVDELASEVAVPCLPAVRLAAIYHDAVYDPRSADNEARSAELAATAARELGWADDDIAEVHRLVLATAGHEILPGDAAGAVLIDADLAVLGAEPSVYRAYADGVRAEYAHIDEPAWRTGRPAVLQGFLDRARIYATEPMFRARERRARANLAAEIASLTR